LSGQKEVRGKPNKRLAGKDIMESEPEKKRGHEKTVEEDNEMKKGPKRGGGCFSHSKKKNGLKKKYKVSSEQPRDRDTVGERVGGGWGGWKYSPQSRAAFEGRGPSLPVGGGGIGVKKKLRKKKGHIGGERKALMHTLESGNLTKKNSRKRGEFGEAKAVREGGEEVCLVEQRFPHVKWAKKNVESGYGEEKRENTGNERRSRTGQTSRP